MRRLMFIALGLLLLSLGCTYQTAEVYYTCSDGSQVVDPSKCMGATGPSEGVESTTGFTDVSAEEAKALIDSNPELIIIDVSPLYAQGHIPGAVNHPFMGGSLEAALPALDKEATYLIYCHSDAVSISAAQLMADEGFENLYRLDGNYQAWVDAGYETEP